MIRWRADTRQGKLEAKGPLTRTGDSLLSFRGKVLPWQVSGWRKK